jgi:hypothetical protein
MTKQLGSSNISAEHGIDPQPQPRRETYEPPRIRVVNEEEVLSAFQVVLSAGSASWWMV